MEEIEEQCIKKEHETIELDCNCFIGWKEHEVHSKANAR